MWNNQIFSIMENVGDDIDTIRNIIVCDDAHTAAEIARDLYGDRGSIFDTTLYPVHIGDHLINGEFWRGGKKIPRNQTEAEQIEALKAENNSLKERIAELIEAQDINDELLMALITEE